MASTSASEEKTRRLFSFQWIAAILATLGVLAIGAVNVEQKRRWVAPDDGCVWIETDRGVEAREVDPEGPASRAGIVRGDLLRSITANGVRHEIQGDLDVARLLYEIGVWSQATYALERRGVPIESSLIIAPPPERVLRLGQYFEIIGVLYFLIGIFVLIRRSQAPHAFHFYWVCLTSFVVYVFDYTARLDAFDWTVFWMDRAAGCLLPPLFLHFYLEFPRREHIRRDRGIAIALLYLPGAALLAAWVEFKYGLLGLIPAHIGSLTLLNNLGVFHFGGYFVGSVASLAWTSWWVRAPELRQQLKWVTLGTAAALPFFVLQALHLIGLAEAAWVDLAILPLGLIPMSFGYAIQRHRLMDVDIIFKRGATYTLATASIVGLYATVVALTGKLTGDLLGAGFPLIGTAAQFIAIVAAAVLFAPIKDQFQVWLDKFFYRGRYDARQTMMDFGRTLGSEVRVETMLEGMLDRIERALLVERAAVFLESASEPGRFTLARSVGGAIPSSVDLDFLRTGTRQPHLFLERDVAGLHYFIPCRVKDRAIAYIGLGHTRSGAHLTSEDLELVQTVSGYAGIAIENARLYKQLIQNEKLSSIGLLAAGVAHEVNTPLAVISNCSQMLRKALGPEDPQYKLLEKITKQTFRASEIVNGLLSFSRTSPTQFTRVDLHATIDETLSLVEHQFRSAGIQVERAFGAERPATFGNTGQLQQVFLNLFLNARDAMPGGGRLKIRTRSDDSRVEVLVEDTGMGIHSDDINKIFDPFFTTKTAGKGTGLGLSVSYGIVQEHGGRIAVESREGEGTAFKLFFPVAGKPQAAVKA